jgi:DnaJ-class molecular chaperone
MPKGKKEKDFPPPPKVICDFCGGTFRPQKWNQRTCIRCKAKGAPSQEQPSYDVAVQAWLIACGRIAKRKRKGKANAKVSSRTHAVRTSRSS